LGVSGFEIVETTATTAAVIDFQALSTYDTVRVSGAMAVAAAGADTAGSASVTSTSENSDTLVISAARGGQTGGTATAAGKNGGDGINIRSYSDNGSNTANLRFVGNADITGGNGSAAAAASNGNGGNGGDGLDAVDTETLNITIVGTALATGTADTVTFAAGALGAEDGTGTAGSAGSSVIVGTNATIVLTSELDSGTTGAALHNNIDLGTIWFERYTQWFSFPWKDYRYSCNW